MNSDTILMKRLIRTVDGIEREVVIANKKLDSIQKALSSR